MNYIEASCCLDETRLSQRDYTLSLIRQACRQGLLTEEEVHDMKRQLLELVAERTEAWNHGESSSVRIEQAQDFLESILFVMGVQLKAEPSADRALETLKTETVRICFEKGMERVKRKIAISRLLQRRMGKNLFSSQNGILPGNIHSRHRRFFPAVQPGVCSSRYPHYGKLSTLCRQTGSAGHRVHRTVSQLRGGGESFFMFF